MIKGKTTLVAILITMLVDDINAQLPFFTGMDMPKTYALENRLEFKEKSSITTIAKTFRKEKPIWMYIGVSYNKEDGFGDIFYGAAPILNFKNKLRMFPALEGCSDKFSGATIYSTILLGKDYHIDLHPRINKDLNYTFTSFNLGKTYKGITFGLTSDTKNKFKDSYFRVAKIKKGNFIDGGINFGKKKVRIAFQKAF